MATAMLSGIRVLDLTRFIAGPTASKVLADMGAEVIKVESIQRMDLPTRRTTYAENTMGEEPWNRSGSFHSLHNNKLGITLFMEHARGIEMFKRLVVVSDVVMENHSPRVMKNWGIDYPVLRGINPSVVLVSMSGFGQTGPKSDYVAFGPTMEAASGLTSVGGYPGSMPGQSSRAYADWVTGLHGAAGTLMALFQRSRTGVGQHVAVSGHEAMISHIGELFLDYALNRRVAMPRGNRDDRCSPHGHYRCMGDDDWVTIAVTNDHEWAQFCEAAGHSEWAKDPRFVDVLGRLKNRDELDRLVETWTQGHTPREVMESLQAAGVPSGMASKTRDQLFDPHLIHRRFFEPVEHPAVGNRPHYRMLAAKSSIDSMPPLKHAPLLGEHNGQVLQDILGLSADEMASLEREKVIGTAPPRLPSTSAERVANIRFMVERGYMRHEPDYLEKLSQAYGAPMGLAGRTNEPGPNPSER